MTTADGIPRNLDRIRRQIARFEKQYARLQGSVQLIAVSKGQPADKIATAFACGQRDFGENYLQEALAKIQRLKRPVQDPPPLSAARRSPGAGGEAAGPAPGSGAGVGPGIVWHFIGPVQSNKTRDIAENFTWVHSVERVKTARRLSDQRPPGLPPLKVLIQVNLSGESSKSGVSLSEVLPLAGEISGFPGISLEGLMAVPAPGLDFETQRLTFWRLAAARDELLQRGFAGCRHLSMGMSADFEAAIAEGATMIRIGTGIFGPRQKS